MNETNDIIKGNGFDDFRSLPAPRKRFVLAVASGISPVDALERISPHLTKGSRAVIASKYMKEPAVMSALSDMQRMKDHNIDISFNKQVERFFSLIGLIHQQNNLSAKHLELIFKIYQEINRMAGHMKNADPASISYSPVQIIIEQPINTNTSELSETNESSNTIETTAEVIHPAIIVEPPTNDASQ